MADVEEVAMLPPQTDQEEDAGENNSKESEEDKNKGEDNDELVASETDEASEEKQIEGSAIETQEASLTSSATSDSETSSLVETWTLVEKDEAENENTEESVPKDEEERNFEDKAPVETDSESIETISEDEAQAFPTLPLASFCYVSGPGSSRGMSSQVSTMSSFSMASDGIPIRAGDEIDDGEDELQYEWNTEGEREIEPERDSPDQELLPVHLDHGQRVEEVAEELQESDLEEEPVRRSREASGEPGQDSEPGYDLDDDGLPGAPLPPLQQSEDLYPSQELDESFHVIERGEVYRHIKNLKVDSFLTACLVLTFALVVGLGLGHFLGLSETLEVQEKYAHLQEEQLDNLKDDLVSCIHGEEGQGGDDQDLDDRVIRQLWEDNKELREEVIQLRKNTGDDADEAMAAILRDRINDLLTANADLEREVARLRYADAARGAAESVETLDKLRQTRDTLNDILTENDQLKIEVAKARYGEPPLVEQPNVEVNREQILTEQLAVENKMEQLAIENKLLKEQLEKLSMEEDGASTLIFDKFKSAIKFLEDIDLQRDFLTNTKKMEDMHTPWPSKRHEELKTDDDQPGKDGAKRKKEDVNDDDDVKNSSMESLSKYLAGLVGNFGNKIITKSGNVDWTIAKKFIKGLKTDLGSKFDTAGKLAKEEIDLVVDKFDDLRKFVDTEGVQQHMQATRVAAAKLVKSLVGSVASLKEASEDAAEKTDWASKFERSAAKMKSSLEKRWEEIKGKWEKVIKDDEKEDEEEDDDEGYKSNDDDDEDEDREKSKKKQQKKYKDEDDDDDDKEDEVKRRKKKQKKHDKEKDEDDDDDGYKSSDDKHKRNQKEKRRQHKKRDDDDDDYREAGGRNKTGEQQRELGDSRGNKFDKKKVGKEEDREVIRRTRRGEMNKRGDWAGKRGEMREQRRREEEQADWIFQRAKHRKETRQEEQRGDWYFERKQ